MSQASSAWHSRLTRRPLLHRGGTLTHTPSQVISAAVRLWCKGARRIQKHLYCMSGKKEKTKRSHDGLSVSVCHFWACHFLTCCKFVRRTKCCCWIWGRTQRALSESLVITGASLFMTANKIALFVAFLWLLAKMFFFFFQVYLVWLHTSQRHAGSILQCDDCFVCLCKKMLSHFKTGHLQLFEWKTSRAVGGQSAASTEGATL